MKNLATVEGMENLLMTFVQAVDVLRHLQCLPVRLHAKDYREQLGRALAEVDDLLTLHMSSPMVGEVKRRSQEVADAERCLGTFPTAFDDPERFYEVVF